MKYSRDPSSTTSLVGNVMVCSLGEMSARGGLFTRGAAIKTKQNKTTTTTGLVISYVTKTGGQRRRVSKQLV